MKTIQIHPKVSPEIANACVVHDLHLPTQEGDIAHRVLVILNRSSGVTRRDMLFGNGGAVTTFYNLVQTAPRIFPNVPDFEQCSYLFINLNCVSATLANAKEEAQRINYERLDDAIKQFQPDAVLLVGKESWDYAKQHATAPYHLADDMNVYGLSIPAKLGKQKFNLYTMPALSTLCSDLVYAPKARTSYLLGFAIRSIAAALTNQSLAHVNTQDIENASAVVLDDIEKFRRFLPQLHAAKQVALDTETDSLNKVAVKMQTLQLSFDKDSTFIIPWQRKESVFSEADAQEIADSLREYFETTKALHLFCNGNFDLNVISSAFKLRYYSATVYDVQAGEVALDENVTILQELRGKCAHPLSLDAIGQRYGFFGYRTNKIGKADRIGVGDMEFTPEVLNYLKYDVCLLHEVKRCQMEIAQNMCYRNFFNVVTNIIGNQILCFSTMNQNGLLVDSDYLLKLNMDDSPLQKEIDSLEQSILNSPEVKKAEDKLNEGNRKGFFGVSHVHKFALNKRNHIKTLFLDVMNLEPLRNGISSEPSFDKAFLKHYAPTNTICNSLIELSARKKLRDAFAHGLLKSVTTHADCQLDNRIRCSYNYSSVVTGRISASDPNMQQIP